MSARRPNYDEIAKGCGGLLKEAVLAIKPQPGVPPALRWVAVKHVFRISRGHAIALCRSVGVDPFVWVRR